MTDLFNESCHAVLFLFSGRRRTRFASFDRQIRQSAAAAQKWKILMATVTLILGEATLTVARQSLGLACGLFVAGGPPSRVLSRVPLGHLRSFLEAVKGNDIQITNENVSGLSQLCDEFDFQNLSSQLSLVQRFGRRRDSKPNFSIGRAGFAAEAAACGARSEAVAARAGTRGPRA
jgi:hypothetical protein